ncbi:hypothetical protein DS2_00265 [Catenovulum agarivorans DS-2]|uniref:Uncharacterized protein n=1 Tax=Catenovulum agarivorans DS-2 TaxID=1328313 RepID=W7R3A3_9ALTE|nr:tetratricopeptide repeat protein [Catenovulum agarivorans]EWH12110.1 hypothetical protein DS2_00265 [Catenovulum agarivorans DS-2]
MKYVIAILLTIVCLTTSHANQISAHPKQLNQAHQAFEQQNYSVALTFYQQAYQQEPLVSTLYNIAVCQFKLSLWQQAQQSFQKIVEQNGDSDLLKYNIAVTHKKLGQVEQAIILFEEIVLLGNDPHIQHIAGQQLDQLEFAEFELTDSPVPSNLSNWFVSAQVGYGHDNNAVAISSDTRNNKNDTLIESLISAAYIGETDIRRYWSVNAVYLNNKYAKHSAYDFSVLGLGASKHFILDGINRANSNDYFYINANAEMLSLSGSDYLNNLRLAVGYHLPLPSQQSLTLESQYKKANAADNQYQHLAGFAWQNKIIWQFGDYNNRLKLTLNYTIDDKNDLVDEESFTSYSANRSSVKFDKNIQLNDWLLSFSALYKVSAYHDPHQFSDGSTLNRQDKRINLSQRTEYTINPNWRIFFDLNWTDNNSNSSTYSYQQTLIMLGVSFDL